MANQLKRARPIPNRHADGIELSSRFSRRKISPFDAVEWKKRRSDRPQRQQGVTIFRQENVEVPKIWSQTATNIVASQIFHGKPGSPEREGSVRQPIGRS